MQVFWIKDPLTSTLGVVVGGNQLDIRQGRSKCGQRGSV